MTFLPSDYEVPVSTGNFMKFQKGENTFRVLTSAIVGYIYWSVDNKPVRLKSMPTSLPVDIRTDDNGKPEPIKHFWAFVVWNEIEKKIQVLEVTQKSVMTSIKALVDNVKWGDPKRYDITVTKTGEKLTTEYAVMPNPHTDISALAAEEFMAKKVDLDALFEGKDPFAKAYPTPHSEGIAEQVL